MANEEGYVSPGSRDVAFVETSARVLSWNLWWRFGPWRQRQPLILETLAACDADILCLQELWGDKGTNQAQEIADALGLQACYEPVLAIDDVDWGMGILSKWPIIEQQAFVLPSMPSDDGARDCKAMWARLDGPRGPVDVLNTHLSWRPEESAIRQRQMTAIAEHIKATHKGPMPPVLCGDYNAIPTSDEIRMMTGEAPVPVAGLYFFDAWRAAGHTDAGFTWDRANSLTHMALQPDRRLDYIFVGEPAANGAGHIRTAERIGMTATNGLFPSDHFGVLADLRY
jgi:endonuclease/exonuclease/phosphatase family metal-dependent hydrolase